MGKEVICTPIGLGSTQNTAVKTIVKESNLLYFTWIKNDWNLKSKSIPSINAALYKHTMLDYVFPIIQHAII